MMAQLRKKIPTSEKRSLSRIREHYEIEKELANRLKGSTREERTLYYNTLYDELFQRVPDHPMLTAKSNFCESENGGSKWALGLLEKFIKSDFNVLEIGPGDCAIATYVAKRVRKIYAVDVSQEIVRTTHLPVNLEIKISDGVTTPLPPESIDMAYSNQLMEHLHPDDALDQLKSIFAVLKKGGSYLCVPLIN